MAIINDSAVLLIGAMVLGPEFGAVYFGIWAVVLLVAGIVALEKRDA